MPYAPLWFSFGFELICLATIIYDLRLQYTARGRELLKHQVSFFYGLVVLLLVLDFFWGYVTPEYYPRLAPFLRVTLLVLHTTSLRGQLRVVWFVLPRFLSIMFLFAIYIMLYAWLALFLFEQPERKEYFPTVCDSIVRPEGCLDGA